MRGIGPRAALWLSVVAALPLAVTAPATAEKQPYTVQCETAATSGTHCKVDKATYIGWRTYHAFCHVCHAQDAVGSTFAPGLLERMREIDKARYLQSLNEGYTGQIGVMPAWKDNPNVNKRYEQLYAYLRARSDGVLPPGRPKRLQ
ncbi:MAG: cytochrome C [Gammaproteobacteria bacterium]|nr:cytochrome C [Gammaproteobacteria bacterium]